MKAKTKKSSKERVTKRPATKKAKTKRNGASNWHFATLPKDFQAELEEGIEKSKRGEDLLDFEEAMEDAERKTKQILEILNSPSEKSKPVE